MQITALKIFAFLTLIALRTIAQQDYVELSTNKGKIVIMLYDKTPQHKKMFISEIKKGTYENAVFNRVIKDFVSQAGELDEPILAAEKLHPEMKPHRLAAEIDRSLIHKRGALGAGRDDNPEKSSYFNQIYLVSGKVMTDADLDALEKKTSRKMSLKNREIYKTQGGVPRLDLDYTIFGEIVQGLDIAEQINKVETDKDNVPLSPVVFTARLLGKQEVKAFKRSK
jgi:cyclophilin family peptidyl-prolyl cis-trans isomerase